MRPQRSTSPRPPPGYRRPQPRGSPRPPRARRAERFLPPEGFSDPAPAEVSDSLRARAALGGRVKIEPLFGESLRELAEDVCRPLLKLDIGCFTLRFSERDHQPRTQIEQADDEIGCPRPTGVEFEIGTACCGSSSHRVRHSTATSV